MEPLQPGYAELEWAMGSHTRGPEFHADTLPKQRMQRRNLLHTCCCGPRHAWLHMHRLQALSLQTGPGKAQSMAQHPGCAGAGAAGPGACAACRPCMTCCARREAHTLAACTGRQMATAGCARFSRCLGAKTAASAGRSAAGAAPRRPAQRRMAPCSLWKLIAGRHPPSRMQLPLREMSLRLLLECPGGAGTGLEAADMRELMTFCRVRSSRLRKPSGKASRMEESTIMQKSPRLRPQPLQERSRAAQVSELS